MPNGAKSNSSPAASTTTAPEPIADVLARLPFAQRAARLAAMSPEEKAAYDRHLDAQRAAQDQDLARREAADEQRRKAKLVESLTADLGPRYHPARCSLDTFRVQDTKAQGPVLARLQALAESLDVTTADGSGLVFIGGVGTGKDHLAAALLYHAAGTFGLTCKWVNGRSTFQASRDAMTRDTTESELIRPLVAPAVLCISDPIPVGGVLTAWNADLLYRVIDERYRQIRPTWLTLNVRSTKEADERLSPPVWDRLRDQCEVIECLWASYRRERR